MNRILLLMAVLCLQACSTTDPGTAAGITYRLPRTDANVTLGIDIDDCSPLKLTSSLQVDAVAGAQDKYFHVAGSELSADVTKRAITIDVDSNGVISSVNATSTDQATVIVGNLVKIGSVIATAGLFGLTIDQPTPITCNDDTVRNVARLKALKSALKSSLDALPKKGTSPKEIADAQKNIDALASDVVTTAATVHRDLMGTVKLESFNLHEATTINVPFQPSTLKTLKELFNGIDETSIELFQIDVLGVVAPAPVNGLTGGSTRATDECHTYITVPVAKRVDLTLTPTGKLVKNATQKIPSYSMYASQIAGEGTFCISAEFGENRTMGLKFDKFGGVTEFSWSADSRAANITSALAGSASDASTIAGKIAPSDLTREKAELDELTTKNNLQLARVCQAILAAGGTSCK